MTITLSPETEAKLSQQAKFQGKEISTLAEDYVVTMLEWEERDLQVSLETTTRSLRAAEEGRTKPASEVIAKMRETLRKGQ